MDSLAIPSKSGNIMVRGDHLPEMILPDEEGCVLVFGQREIKSTLTADQANSLFFFQSDIADQVFQSLSETLPGVERSGVLTGYGRISFRDWFGSGAIYSLFYYKVFVDLDANIVRISRTGYQVHMGYECGRIEDHYTKAHPHDEIEFKIKDIIKYNYAPHKFIKAYPYHDDVEVIGNVECDILIQNGNADREMYTKMKIACMEYESRIRQARIIKQGLSEISRSINVLAFATAAAGSSQAQAISSGSKAIAKASR